MERSFQTSLKLPLQIVPDKFYLIINGKQIQGYWNTLVKLYLDIHS